MLKIVINDDGGVALPADFTLILTGADGIHDDGVDYESGDDIILEAGVAYTLSEIPNAGYNLVGIACADNTTSANVGNPFTPALAQNITCTATNNDIAGELSLLKIVINDDGGVALPADFTLILTGADGIHDDGVDYESGDDIILEAGVAYTLSEIPNAGYNLVGIACVDNTTSANVGNPFPQRLRKTSPAPQPITT